MIDIVELSGRSKSKLIQFAIDVNKVKQDKLRWAMLISEKYDGCYCLALKHEDGITIYSRTGEIYTSMKHIELQLSNALSHDDIVIFEAYADNVVQSTISGWCRDTKNQHKELYAVCHTYLSLPEFINGGFNEYYRNLQIMTEKLAWVNSDVIRIAQQTTVYSMEEALETAESVWVRGGEGCVLRDPLAKYQGGKRNASIIKVKQSVTYDLEVIGVEIGKGKYSDTLGALVVRWSNGKTLSISGMTDAQRREWWDNPQTIIGKIVEVMGMRDSSKGLLREPRMKSVRHDKCEGDF